MNGPAAGAAACVRSRHAVSSSRIPGMDQTYVPNSLNPTTNINFSPSRNGPTRVQPATLQSAVRAAHVSSACGITCRCRALRVTLRGFAVATANPVCGATFGCTISAALVSLSTSVEDALVQELYGIPRSSGCHYTTGSAADARGALSRKFRDSAVILGFSY